MRMPTRRKAVAAGLLVGACLYLESAWYEFEGLSVSHKGGRLSRLQQAYHDPVIIAPVAFTAAEASIVSKLAASVQGGIARPKQEDNWGTFPSIERVCHRQMSNKTWAPYQDKLAVKDVVREWSGGQIHTATALLVAREAKDVTVAKIQALPDSYVVKSSHGTGGVVIVKDGVLRCLKEPCDALDEHQKYGSAWCQFARNKTKCWNSPADLAPLLRAHCANLLEQHSVSSHEASYTGIPPGCLFEELIAEADSLLSELQVWVVDRKPFFIRHDVELTDRSAGGYPKVPYWEQPNESTWASKPLAYYFTADGHHIPGLHIRYDCEATTPAAYAQHCSTPDHERPTLPLTAATRKLLVDFSVRAAEETGANFLRVDMFRMNDSQLAFGELTFTSMRCHQKLSPVLVDTVLGVAAEVPEFTSQLLGKLVTHVVCDVAPPHTRSHKIGCREGHEELNERQESEVAALMKLDESLKPKMNLTKMMIDKRKYFDTISDVCLPFEAAALGAVAPDDLRRQFAAMRTAAQKVGALPAGASASRGGISFPFEVTVVPELGRVVVPLHTVPRGDTVWEATEDNVAHFRTRQQLEAHLMLLPDALACDVLHFLFTWEDGCTFSCDGECCEPNEDGPHVVYALDEGSFVNHAFPHQSPSSASINNMTTFASRDIEPGTPLMEDYGLFTWSLPWHTQLFHDLSQEQQRRSKGDTKRHVSVRELLLGLQLRA